MYMNKENENKNLHAVSDEELNQVVGGAIYTNDRAFKVCSAIKDKATCNENNLCWWLNEHCVAAG